MTSEGDEGLGMGNSPQRPSCRRARLVSTVELLMSRLRQRSDTLAYVLASHASRDASVSPLKIGRIPDVMPSNPLSLHGQPIGRDMDAAPGAERRSVYGA